MDAEEAIALAQTNKVGSLIVIEDGQIVGITTTNDFFYKIINPLLGIGIPGTRVEVNEGGEGKALQDIISIINNLGFKIKTLHIEYQPDKPKKDVCFHIESTDIGNLIAAIKDRGYVASTRRR